MSWPFLKDSHPDLKKLTSMDCFVDCLRQLFSEVIKLVKLYLTVPLSNATAERSLSTLRRVKTYLRSCMTQEHLNHFVMLHGHTDFTDRLSLIETARSFVEVLNLKWVFSNRVFCFVIYNHLLSDSLAKMADSIFGRAWY